MRGGTLARVAAVVQLSLLAGALAVPASVAAATLGFTLSTPTVSTVQYSDFTVLRGTYTCVNDATSNCPTTASSRTATFYVRQSGDSTWLSVGTVTNSFAFPSSCSSTCSFNFQLTWKAGRALSISTPPGTYDLRLTSTFAAGEQVLLSGVTVTRESTTTTYGGATAGMGGSALSLAASVLDADLGLSAGNGIYSPDANIFGANLVTWELFDSTNTTSLAGPVSATLLSSGLNLGSPSLVLPAAGGTYKLRTTFGGNTYYSTSSDLDTVTVTASNTPPVLTVPASPLTAEASSPDGAYRTFSFSATDAEDVPAPIPTCDYASGDLFPIGDTVVSCSVMDSGGLSDADSFTIHVSDTTDPGMTVTTDEDDNGAGWYNAASNDGVAGLTIEAVTVDLVGVTSLTCTINGDDVGALDPSGDSFVVGDGSHEIACTAIDGAGNSASDSATFAVDQTAPSISAAVSPEAADTGWWNVATGAPTVTYTCADEGSGIASCTDPFEFGEGAGQGDTGTAVDAAGNSASASVSDVDVDLTPPSISALLDVAPSASGWWNISTGAPTVTYACSDDGSGLASCSDPYSFGEGADQGDTGTAIDVAGNSATASVSDVDVDLTAPGSIAFVGGALGDGGSYVFGSVPAGPTACSATDAGSGVASCTVSGYATAVGSHTITALATDVAGNAGSATMSYTVLPWTLVGFSNTSMTSFNQAKAGASVNLRFQAFAGGTELTSLDVVSAFTQTQISCTTLLPIGPTTSALLSKGAYVKSANGFQAKWDPPASPNTCWKVAIVTADGSSLEALFQLK